MAYDAVREQLDALLGANRNGTSSGPADFTDPRVCKHYLVAGFCPLPLFGNTKADMGTCGGIHSEDLRADYLAVVARPSRAEGGWRGGGGGRRIPRPHPGGRQQRRWGRRRQPPRGR